MDKVEITIGNKDFLIQVADTPSKRMEGLQNISELPKDEGMIFLFDPEDYHDGIGMWMKDTHIPLDIVFVDEDWNVIRVVEGEPLSENIISEEDAVYVIELNANSGVEKGDFVDLIELVDDYDEFVEPPEDYWDDDDEEDEEDDTPLFVIDSSGKVQMELQSGERIFSRGNTKTLIKMSHRALKSKSDTDYKRLGNKVFKYIKTQDEREKEYVEIP